MTIGFNSNTNLFVVSDNSTTGGTASYFGGSGGNLIIGSPAFHVGSNVEAQTPAGTKIGVKQSTVKDISPKLYFSYVKHKLSKSEVAKLKPRIARLHCLAEDALRCGQKGLYESLLQQLAVTVREFEVSVAGYDTWVTKEIIEKFKDKVEGRVVEFHRLEEFPRPLPSDVSETLKAVREKGLFDEYWVLHTNLTKEVAKTAEKKIREKDPILFGRFAYDPERFFYIADWVDEYCDLTMKKFVEVVQKKLHPQWEPSKLREPTDEEITALLEEVKARHERQQNVNSGNFRDRAAAEAEAAKTNYIDEAAKVRAEKEAAATAEEEKAKAEAEEKEKERMALLHLPSGVNLPAAEKKKSWWSLPIDEFIARLFGKGKGK